jgi:hypothetical protein
LREADALFQNRKHPLETFSQKLLLFRITRHQTACAIHQQAASALVIIVHCTVDWNKLSKTSSITGGLALF